ncbi:MAG: ROK family transcriptional regulator [Candidatus Dormibacteria bacterium]
MRELTGSAQSTPAPRATDGGLGKVAHHLMREVNRSLLLDHLRRGGEMSRVDLARLTGLSKPTVSSIVEQLLQEGLAHETGTRPPLRAGGRPPALLTYNDAAEAFAGVQFGVHTTHVAVTDGRGTVVATEDRPSRPGDAAAGITDATVMVDSLLAGRGIPRSRLRAIGAAVPGLVTVHGGECRLAPNLGWRDVPVKALLEAALRVPATVNNSSLMAARAEGRDGGAAAGCASYVWVYAGTGIGAGIIDRSRALVGDRGFSGEIGHSSVVDGGPRCACGKSGCLETVASSQAIVRATAAALATGEASLLMTDPGVLSSASVIAAAHRGDRLARRVITEAAEHLGRGVSYLTNVLNPALVVIGGPLADAGPSYIASVRRSLQRHAMSQVIVPVVATKLGTDAPLLGALQTAVDLRTPSYRVVAAPPS